MKKSDLKTGMIVRTEHNRLGVVELEKNRIDFCYDPVLIEEYKHLNKVSLDEVFFYGGNKIGVGLIVTKELQEKYPDVYCEFNIGDLCIAYDIVAIYDLHQIYSNGMGEKYDMKEKIIDICDELDADIYWKRCNFLENEEDDEIPTFYSRDECRSISFRELLLWYLPQLGWHQDVPDCNDCDRKACDRFRHTENCQSMATDKQVRERHYQLFMELVDIYAFYTQRALHNT